MAGPVALVGSGEYTDAMIDVDKQLLDGRPRRYVQIPTAAAPEGEQVLDKWVGMGVTHAAKLDAEAVPLRVRDRADADDPAIVAQLDGAGLIYFSGGNPLFLADTLRDTALWRRVVELHEAGTALGGCSAGAMAFGGWVPDIRHPTRAGRPGLGLFAHLRVLPHFDRFLGRMPDLLLRPFMKPIPGVHTVGVDEDTALVGGPEHYVVQGRQSAWILDEGTRTEYAAGTAMELPAHAE
ncbi:MAG: type 1 glutamine amidotransferase-like domain-containing protein [Catenulispora sp.]|nr:type 1 glutamine amidotransferase-like domain-containing protein [Catenulispora sp.]